MNKRVAVVAGLVFAGSSFFLLGEQVTGCLGPLGVTTAECAARLAPTGYRYVPGPSPGTAGLVGVPLVVFVATLIPWRRLARLHVIQVVMAAIGAGVIGATYYDLTRPTSLTQTNEFSGRTYTAILGDNADLRILTALFAGAITATVIAWMLASIADRDRVASID